MRRIAAGLLIALALPAAASAHHRGTVAPPGNSGVSQYLETIPSAGGGRPAGTIGSGGGGSGGSGRGGSGVLSSATYRAFAQQGAAGRDAAALANATAPSGLTGAGGSAGGAGYGRLPGGGSGSGGFSTAGGSSAASGSSGATSSSGAGDSPTVSLAKALIGSSGGGGLGPLLPAILVALVIGGGLMAIIRRSRTA